MVKIRIAIVEATSKLELCGEVLDIVLECIAASEGKRFCKQLIALVLYKV